MRLNGWKTKKEERRGGEMGEGREERREGERRKEDEVRGRGAE